MDKLTCAVKAWKKHKIMTLNLLVPIGKVKFVFYDKTFPDQYREEIIGEDNYCRLTVPPDIWFGFQISDYPSLVANISDIEHDDKENIKVDIDTFAFKWSEKTMKVVILAGGFGSRLSEYTETIQNQWLE